MDLDRDPSWNNEASRVARELDHNDVRGAQEMLRRDMYQLQGDPHAQHEFLNMVNRYDHKGYGADLNIYRDPYNGQEQWQISAPNYGPQGGGYEYPPPAPMPRPYYPQEGTVIVQPNPGEAVAAGVVGGIVGGLLGGALRRR